ncbi:MAG: hypothetical protein JW951_08175 [Lentisphaerae bacterium]|nr:hypothetical protein [Lentisphaerota bacterium]
MTSDILSLSAGKTELEIVATAEAMGARTAAALAERLKQADRDGAIPVLWLMAAPSAFPFYGAFVALAACDEALRRVLRRTHCFQFDDYPIARESTAFEATFRRLLERYFYEPLARLPDAMPQVHPLELTADRAHNRQVCGGYADHLFALQQKGACIIELKGTGMDGHWGFHGAETPLEKPAGMMEVPMNVQNIHQQMLDWPRYFQAPGDVPATAWTFNVEAFLKADAIYDNTPQAAKEFAVLAAYASAAVIPEIPSSALKRHSDSRACVTQDAARALLEWREHGSLAAQTFERLTGLWVRPGGAHDAACVAHMLAVLDSLGINTADVQAAT